MRTPWYFLLFAACAKNTPAPAVPETVDTRAALQAAVEMPIPDRLRAQRPQGLVVNGRRMNYGVAAGPPDDPEVFRRLRDGIAEYDAGRLDEAEATFRAVLKEHPQEPMAIFELGLVLQARENLKGALHLWQPLLEAERPEAMVFVGIGNALDQSGQSAQALEVYDAGLEAWPDHAVLHQERGKAKLGAGDMQGAIRDLERAVYLDPSRVRPFQLLAELHSQRGNHLSAGLYAEMVWFRVPTSERGTLCAIAARGFQNISEKQVDDTQTELSVRMQKESVVVRDPTDLARMEAGELPFLMRYEVAHALAAERAQVSVSDGLDLDERVALRRSATEVFAEQGGRAHPIVAMHMRMELAGCADAYHAIMLGSHDPAIRDWLQANPDGLERLNACQDSGVVFVDPALDLRPDRW